MDDILHMGYSFIAGLIIGAIFFFGLWITVKKIARAKMPALIFMVSLFCRISVALIGFYFISMGSWKKMLICLLGFVTARWLIMLRIPLNVLNQAERKKEAGNEA